MNQLAYFLGSWDLNFGMGSVDAEIGFRCDDNGGHLHSYELERTSKKMGRNFFFPERLKGRENLIFECHVMVTSSNIGCFGQTKSQT